MRFSKLLIRNFRSIGPEGVALTFSESRNLAVFIGANGAGKSNMLAALGIVLGVYPFSRFDVEEEDFFDRNLDRELLIELHLFPPITDRDVYQKDYSIAGFRFRAWRKTRGDSKGILAQEHYCFDLAGKTIVKPARIFKKGEHGVDNSMRPSLVQDHSWKIGTAFYLDAPSLERFFDKTTGWSALARLFDLYREDFPALHNTFAQEDGTIVPSGVALEKLSQKLIGVLRTQKLKEIETKLSSRIAEYVGPHPSQPFQIAFGLPSHREIFEKWVALQVSERKEAPPLSIDRLGAGYRALLRLAVIETLLDMQADECKFLLLIEEPEIYLHIHLQRYFARLLRRISKNGNQVIIATHAPEMVEISEPHNVVRLHKLADGTTRACQVPEDVCLDFKKTEQKVSRMGNEEILFASHVILVEGKDDQGIVEFLLQTKGIDIDAYSMSVVNCDGIKNLPDYIRLCIHLGMDFYVLFDRDDPVADKKRNDDIESLVGCAKMSRPCLHGYSPFLEAAMGAEKHCGLDQLLALLSSRPYVEIQHDFPDLVKPIEEFVTSRGVAGAPQSGKG